MSRQKLLISSGNCTSQSFREKRRPLFVLSQTYSSDHRRVLKASVRPKHTCTSGLVLSARNLQHVLQMYLPTKCQCQALGKQEYLSKPRINDKQFGTSTRVKPLDLIVHLIIVLVVGLPEQVR